MNRDTKVQTPAARLINALIRVLSPGDEVCVESELLKHFPFAPVGMQAQPRPSFRIPTTVHGSL